MKKSLTIISLLFMITVVIGCGKNGNQENATTLLNNCFTNLSQTDYDEFQDWISESENPDIPDWIEKDFKVYSTDNFYTDFLNNSYYMIPVFAYESKKNMTLEQVEFKENDKLYEFAATLIITEKNNESESKKIDIKGTVQINDEEKVDYLNFYNISEIFSSIQ